MKLIWIGDDKRHSVMVSPLFSDLPAFCSAIAD